MSVMNRRNAMFGWLAWAIAKQALRSKAWDATHRNQHSSSRRKIVVPAAIAAAAAGAVFFYKRQQDDDAEH